MPEVSSTRQLDQYIVRFPCGMRERIKSRAAANRRSMNSEIIVMLERILETKTADELQTQSAV